VFEDPGWRFLVATSARVIVVAEEALIGLDLDTGSERWRSAGVFDSISDVRDRSRWTVDEASGKAVGYFWNAEVDEAEVVVMDDEGHLVGRRDLTLGDITPHLIRVVDGSLYVSGLGRSEGETRAHVAVFTARSSCKDD
jgi:hypothetical protein